ncbi:hypothetical protein [Paenarthrobacter nitroguajacolicus]|uniref:hypothetical protein n=1 Tax=Paenarthrobacter nitroguajacolicus TaxID=211146 RepID=UPI000AB82CCD|nr:hypothetical protein [Paenarthrobacter nitroguajacolicus]
MAKLADKPFRARPERYWMNIDGAQHTYSRPGVLEKADGTEEPAIIIFRDRYVLSVLPIEDAIRLSNEIIDATERPAI